MFKIFMWLILLGATSGLWQTSLVAPGISVEAPGKLIGGGQTPPGIDAFLLLRADDVVYVAAEFTPGTDQTPQEMLDSFTTGMVHPGRGTLEWQKTITLQGCPGREVQYTVPGLLSHRSRAFIVDKSIIQAEVVWKPGRPAPATLPRFLNSLKLRTTRAP